MVARVKVVRETPGIVVAADGLVKIHAAVEFGRCSQPFVERGADDVAVLVVGAPAVYGQERAAVNLEPELARMRDVERAHAVDEVVGRGHVAPGAESVDLDTDRVDDVVDAVLHYDGSGPGHIHLDGEARCALETVSRIRDAVVFAQDARAAHRAADDGDTVKPFAGTAQRQIVGPVLCRDGIPEAHEREVLLFGKDVDGVEEVDPVRFAREVVGEACRFREIPVAVLAAGKRARDGRAGVHLREVAEVHAHIESFARGHVERDFVTQDFFARGDSPGSAAAECDRGRRIFDRRIFCLCGILCLRDIRLGNRYGFGSGEVRKVEPELIARKAGAYRVAECQVFCVGGFLAVGDGGGVTPAGHPFRKLFWHG